ncbi:hypothetical protein Fmac_025200 [Flemingia macrophylla]|uniref:Uncharacterized protein n=1 Tax=Flemingia macrophylla TaxID=520843 RepID=A0ABD1LRI7_9FABA
MNSPEHNSIVSSAELLRIGGHFFNQVSSLSRGHVTQGSSTGSINHTPLHVIQALIKILQ